MANIERWNPFQELERVREGLLGPGGWLSPFRFGSGDWGPAIDVRETETDIIVHAEVPGINPEDLEVIINEDNLTLRGEVRQETSQTNEGYHRMERRYGRFHRTIEFPVAVKEDQAVAEYRDGILEIKVPKSEVGSTTGRRLTIRRGESPPTQ